jgi:hypothetical protein
MVSISYKKSISKEMVNKIEVIQNECKNKGQKCSFIRASRILARRIDK